MAGIMDEIRYRKQAEQMEAEARAAAGMGRSEAELASGAFGATATPQPRTEGPPAPPEVARTMLDQPRVPRPKSPDELAAEQYARTPMKRFMDYSKEGGTMPASDWAAEDEEYGRSKAGLASGGGTGTDYSKMTALRERMRPGTPDPDKVAAAKAKYADEAAGLQMAASGGGGGGAGGDGGFGGGGGISRAFPGGPLVVQGRMRPPTFSEQMMARRQRLDEAVQPRELAAKELTARAAAQRAMQGPAGPKGLHPDVIKQRELDRAQRNDHFNKTNRLKVDESDIEVEQQLKDVEDKVARDKRNLEERTKSGNWMVRDPRTGLDVPDQGLKDRLAKRIGAGDAAAAILRAKQERIRGVKNQMIDDSERERDERRD